MLLTAKPWVILLMVKPWVMLQTAKLWVMLLTAKPWVIYDQKFVVETTITHKLSMVWPTVNTEGLHGRG